MKELLKSYTERTAKPIFSRNQYLFEPFCTSYEAYKITFYSKIKKFSCNTTKTFLWGASEMEPVALDNQGIRALLAGKFGKVHRV